MRYSAAENREIIHMVERSDLSIKKILAELGVPHSVFYRWYLQFADDVYVVKIFRQKGGEFLIETP